MLLVDFWLQIRWKMIQGHQNPKAPNELKSSPKRRRLVRKNQRKNVKDVILLAVHLTLPILHPTPRPAALLLPAVKMRRPKSAEGK